MAKREKQYFSISQISCFRGCKQEWAYKYKEGLKSKAPQRPLYMGTTLHKLLEIRANRQSWVDYLYDVIVPEFCAMPMDYQSILGEDFIDCCYKIMTQYDWLYDKEDIKYLATEVKIDAKIKGSKRFVGVVDAIVEISGDQYIMEHKTFKTTKMSLDSTWLNSQTCLYIKVLNDQGWNIKGVVWDMIKTAAPKPPRVLKNGQFGKQYADQTLLSFEWAGIDVATLPPDVYEEIKDLSLELSSSTFNCLPDDEYREVMFGVLRSEYTFMKYLHPLLNVAELKPLSFVSNTFLPSALTL